MLQSVRTISAAAATAAFALLVVVSPAAADCDKEPGKNLSKKCDDVGPVSEIPLASTPELGSLLLFGSGLVGAGGYALTRIRAARRPD